MTIQSVFAILAFLLSASAYVPYVISVLTSDARPTISSWISWLLMDAAILAGMIVANEIAWQMVAYIVGAICVIGVSVYKGAALGWNWIDSISLVIVIIAVGLWGISGNPNVAIVLSLIAITIGSIPTVVNLWKTPTREPLLPWILILAGGICGVLAIPALNIAAALAPLWFFILQFLVVSLILRRYGKFRYKSPSR